MKKITELTDKEVLALTNDQLDLMVKFRMAEEGIKILTPPIEPTYISLPEPTEVGYTVEGFSHKFRDRELAEKISLAISSVGADKMFSETYNGSNYALTYIKPLESYYNNIGEVKRKLYYSKEVINEMSEIKAQNEKLKSDFQYDLDEYNNEYERGKEVREEVYGTYNAISKKYYDMDGMKARYNEYLTLADGNSDIALNFLKRAYVVDSETEEYITGTTADGKED